MLLLSFPSYVQSQKDTLQYKVDLSFSGRRISGTFSQVVAGGGLNVDLLYNNWHLENNTTYRYNKRNTRHIEKNWYDLTTLKYYPNGKNILYPGAFYHFDNNLIYRVRSSLYGYLKMNQLPKNELSTFESLNHYRKYKKVLLK